MELLLIAKPPDRLPEVMGPPLCIGMMGAGDFIEPHEEINVMANETEQQAIERRSWAGFINAEISAFVILAR